MKICAYIFFLHIASYCGQVCVLILGYLKHICRDDIVGVERHENVIGSALSILGVIFGLWDEHMNLLQTGETTLMSSTLINLQIFNYTVMMCWRELILYRHYYFNIDLRIINFVALSKRRHWILF